ncbi:MAG: hypothetical protein ACK52I_23505 [Pseudomonadota bacterium]|jgi:hypothetical protein
MTNRAGRRRQHRRHKARAAIRWNRPCVWLDRHPARVDVRRLRQDLTQEFVDSVARSILGPLSIREGVRLTMRGAGELFAKAIVGACAQRLLGLFTIGDSNARGRR